MINTPQHIRFLVYMALIILANLVSTTLFFRLDLTKNKIYTLSSLSEQTVSNLNEPLTLKIFLSENIPHPYNNLKQELRDLMEEYHLKGGKNFNYQIYEIDKDNQARDKQGNLLSKLAEEYGIQPVNIKSYDNNEVSLVSIYMGMVILQSDLSRTINALGFEDNLEYQISTGIYDLVAKTNTLLSMEDLIRVKLVFSKDLKNLGKDFQNYPEQVEAVVKNLNNQFYNRLAYEEIDPLADDSLNLSNYKLNRYSINNTTSEKSVYASLIVEKGTEHSVINLIEQGLLGAHLREADSLKKPIESVAERLLGVQKTIGYLQDHGTPSLYGNSFGQPGTSLSHFYGLISRSYNLKPVTLDKIPEGLDTLIIAGPTEKFSDWELLQIDQFLMRGGSIGLFLDPFKEELPSGQAAYYSGPEYIPLHTGLEDLISYYGINMKQAYLMDEKAYISRSQTQNGGFKEVKLPFAPVINREAINHDLPMLKNINGLIMLNVAPLEITEETGSRKQILFRSSPESWEMKENINLMPGMITPPSDDKKKEAVLAILADGHFNSRFKGQEPPKSVPNENLPDSADKQKNNALSLGNSTIDSITILEEGTGGKLLVCGSSMILGDNIIGEEGNSENTLFIQGAIDTLAGREDLASLRNRGNANTSIDSGLSPGFKTFVKTFNIVIIPIIVIIAGLFMWYRWERRRKKIQELFSKEVA